MPDTRMLLLFIVTMITHPVSNIPADSMEHSPVVVKLCH